MIGDVTLKPWYLLAGSCLESMHPSRFRQLFLKWIQGKAGSMSIENQYGYGYKLTIFLSLFIFNRQHAVKHSSIHLYVQFMMRSNQTKKSSNGLQVLQICKHPKLRNQLTRQICISKITEIKSSKLLAIIIIKYI